jgi:twitching motility protein PilT
MDLTDILKRAVSMGASDIHLSKGCPPLARVDGELMEVPGFSVLRPEIARSLIFALLYENQRAKFEDELELDCTVTVPGLSRFRTNVLAQQGSVEAVLRVIPSKIPKPETLGLGPATMELADLPRGLVLVTGPTGCGKSTTLACLVDRINTRSAKHVITIEDPIEYAYTRKRALIRQREVGGDTKSFREALRRAMRQDPDVILVGEMRDLETISLALTAAETGHLCLATLHTTDSAQTVDRIIDVFPPEQQQQVRVQLGASLKGVVSQILLPRKRSTGRIAARELMLVTPAISNVIREGKTHMIPNMIVTGAKHGMYSMDASLKELMKRGLVEAAEAVSRSSNPDQMAQEARRLGMEAFA